MESLLTFPQPLAVIAPSIMLSDGLGMISSGSTRSWSPSPVQVGHAPYGLLKENSRGVSSSIEIPQSSQA